MKVHSSLVLSSNKSSSLLVLISQLSSQFSPICVRSPIFWQLCDKLVIATRAVRHIFLVSLSFESHFTPLKAGEINRKNMKNSKNLPYGTRHRAITSTNSDLIFSSSSIRSQLHFSISRPLSSGPWLYLSHYVLVYKTYLHTKDDSFKPININILFFVKFANFWYITCFVSNLISIWLRSPMVQITIQC